MALLALHQRNLKVDDYRSHPIETYYSCTRAYQPTYDSISHHLEAGKLIEIFYDFEASDKDARHAAPKEYAALAFDLQGRLLARLRLPIAIAQEDPYAIGAALVGRIPVETLEEGWPGHIAAAMIQNFLSRNARLNPDAMGLSPAHFSDGKSGFHYDLFWPDRPRGQRLEIHESGQRFRFVGEEKWRKVYGLSQPFNGEHYDDVMASHWFSRLGFAHLFPASQKRHDTYREDVRAKAIWEWAFGRQGREGLQLPARWHRKTRRNVLSTRLGDILLANSQTENRARGASGGVVYYDGRSPDPDILHASDEDVAGTAALSFYLRQIDPSGMRFLSEIGDTDKYKAFLQDGQEFGDRPPVGFVHYDEGMLTRGIGMLMATDDAYGDERRALLFNLGHDPSAILPLGHEQLRPLLVQRHNPVFVPLVLNRTPQVADFKRAYAAGAGANLNPEQIHQRRHMLLNEQGFIQRVMETRYDLTHPSPPPNIVTSRALEDDSYNHYGDLKYPSYVDPVSGRRKAIPQDIYARAKDKWDFMRAFDGHLRKVTEGHAVEYNETPEAVTEYKKRFEEAEKALTKVQAGWEKPFVLPQIDVTVTDSESARRHLWLLRHELRGALFSAVPEFWVVNGRGQRLPWEKVMAMPDGARIRQLPLREDRAHHEHLYIRFERNASRHPVISALRVFHAEAFNASIGSREWQRWWKRYVKDNYDEWRAWYDAFVTLGVQGPPNLDPSQHKRLSEAKALQEIDQLLGRASESSETDYLRQVLKTPQGQKLLDDHRAHKFKKIKKNLWTAEKMRTMGLDPKTGFPSPHPHFKVDRKKVVRLLVPDIMLEGLSWDDHWHTHAVINRQERSIGNDLEALRKNGKAVVLEGGATGMYRLAAGAACTRLPIEGERTRRAIDQARGAYASAGMKCADASAQLRLLSCEQVVPIHNEDEVEEGLQHVSLPALDWAALVDARAGGLPAPLKPLQGIIVRDTGQKFTSGPIRLRRTQGGVETGDEYRGRLLKATPVTLAAIDAFSDEDAHRCGKLSAADLSHAWRKIFSDLHVREAARQKLWHLQLARPVSKTSYRYINRAEQPVAMFISRRPEKKDALKSPTRRAVA